MDQSEMMAESLPQSAAQPEGMMAGTMAGEGEEGYTITIVCRPDGTYTVNEVEVDTFEQALKLAVKFHQENPMEGSEQRQFEAGFGQAEGGR